MALKSTVLKLVLQLADLDRNHFADYTLTLAQHPSETAERVMVRVLAYAMHASEDLRFGKGLSNEEEPAVWEIDPSGVIRLWVDVGLPDETRIKKACSKADEAVVLAYGSKAPLWFKQHKDFLLKFKNLRVWQLSLEDSEKLAASMDKNMKMTWTIQEGTVYLGELDIRPLALL